MSSLMRKLSLPVWTHTRHVKVQKIDELITYTIPLLEEEPMLERLVKVDIVNNQLVVIYSFKSLPMKFELKDFVMDFK